MAGDEKKAKQGHRWQPGQSGNPGGRPKGLRALIGAFEADGPLVMQRLLDLTQSGDEKVARAACVDFLDRLYGKPTQPIAGDADRPPLGGVVGVLADPSVRGSIQRALARGATSGDVGDAGNVGPDPERASGDAAVGSDAASGDAVVVDR